MSNIANQVHEFSIDYEKIYTNNRYSRMVIFLQRRGLGALLCYVMGLNESNHFSGLTSAFRAAYEQINLKVVLISAFDRHTSLKRRLISAFDRHTSINRSISADHALAHALEFGGE